MTRAFTVHLHRVVISGEGVYPFSDPFGTPFSSTYMPHRARLAGKPIAGNFICIFDGVQADLEFVKKLFNLQRSSEAYTIHRAGFNKSLLHKLNLKLLPISIYILNNPKTRSQSQLAKPPDRGDYSRKLVCCFCSAPWIA